MTRNRSNRAPLGILHAIAIGVVLTLFTPALARAQGPDVGYLFAGLGSTCCEGATGTVHLGGGGERALKQGLSAGAEFGYLGSLEQLSDWLGVLSVNGSYHFGLRRIRQRVKPFVTAGYSLFMLDGQANLWNIGAGADIWRTNRTGLRVEFRDHVISEYHFLGVRVGLVFR